ncbi:SDR family oxidoreductase, partial [Streptomyces sp. NPDC002784]
MRRRTLLITGASGVVGAAAIPLLRERYEVIALTHRAGAPGRTVAGDVTSRWLGLAPETYRALTDEVDVVVHSAAATGFQRDTDHAWQVNVEGARRVSKFALHAGARLVHLSSAFTAHAGLVRKNATAYAGDVAA